MSSARIVILDGPGKGTKFRVSNQTIIGRHKNNEITLPDNNSSRQHCQIALKEETFLLSDLGSRNGTLLNGQKIAKATPLNNNDRIQIGRTTLLFRISSKTATDATKTASAKSSAKKTHELEEILLPVLEEPTWQMKEEEEKIQPTKALANPPKANAKFVSPAITHRREKPILRSAKSNYSKKSSGSLLIDFEELEGKQQAIAITAIVFMFIVLLFLSRWLTMMFL